MRRIALVVALASALVLPFADAASACSIMPPHEFTVTSLRPGVLVDDHEVHAIVERRVIASSYGMFLLRGPATAWEVVRVWGRRLPRSEPQSYRWVDDYGSSCRQDREPVGLTEYEVLIDTEHAGWLTQTVVFVGDDADWGEPLSRDRRDDLSAAWGQPRETSPAASTVLTATVWAWWHWMAIVLVVALVVARFRRRRSRTVPA